MNKTYNMNLGGLPFQIDEDAYDRLNAYLIAVKRKFSQMQGSDEIVEDIEARIAEMFQEHLGESSRKIVSMRDVDLAIEAMGTPDEFDQFEEQGQAIAGTPRTYHTGKKLYRDPDDKVLGGVISGITKYFGFENPTWARILVAALPILDFFGTLGISTMFLIFLYIIFWVAIPLAETATQKMQMRGERINLDSIERNVSDGVDNVKKNLNSQESRQVGRGIGELFGKIVVGAGKLLLAFGLFIAILIALGLIISFFAAMFGVGVAAPFLNEYIFGNHWLSWVASVGAFLMLIAVPIFIISLLVKLLFKTNTNMPAIAFGTLGAFILGLIMTAFTGASMLKDFSTESSVEQTETLPVNTELSLYSNEVEDTWEDGGIGINESFMTENVDLYILPSLDSTAWIEIKKHAKGKNREDARQRAEALQYNYTVEGNKLIFDEELMLGENQVWREQEVDAYLRIPENTTLRFDGSIKELIKYAKFKGEKFYGSNLTSQEWWKFSEGRLYPIDENGEAITIKETTQAGDDEFQWEQGNSIRVNGDGENVKVKLFGKELIEVDVSETDEKGNVDISIGGKKAIQIKVDEEGEIIKIEKD